MIPLLDLEAQRRRFGGAIERAIGSVVEHGQFINGPEVGEFERDFGEYCGIDQVVGCSSGTDALLMIAIWLELRPADAVIVPAFTFPATPEAFVQLGATPVFADVDEPTFNLTPSGAEEAIQLARESGLNPRAIIAVDLFGQPADYDGLRQVAKAHGIKLIADSAQSAGSTYKGRGIGHHADMTAVSFFPAKPLGCYGDGGAVLTSSEADAELLRSIRSHGQGDTKYDIVRLGANARLDTIQAAVLSAKLPGFAAELERRREIARKYDEGLEGRADLPMVVDGRESAWAQYTIRVANRSEVQSRLEENAIASAVFYPKPLPHQPVYRDCPRVGDVPVSTGLSKVVLSLPMHPDLTDSQVDEVIACVRAVARPASQG